MAGHVAVKYGGIKSTVGLEVGVDVVGASEELGGALGTRVVGVRVCGAFVGPKAVGVCVTGATVVGTLVVGNLDGWRVAGIGVGARVGAVVRTLGVGARVVGRIVVGAKEPPLGGRVVGMGDDGMLGLVGGRVVGTPAVGLGGRVVGLVPEVGAREVGNPDGARVVGLREGARLLGGRVVGESVGEKVGEEVVGTREGALVVGLTGARVVGIWVGCVGLAVVGELVHLFVPAVHPVIVIVAGKNTPSKLHAMNENVSEGCNS